MTEGEQATRGNISSNDCTDSGTSLDKFERLNVWLQEHGGQCQYVEFREYGSGSNDTTNNHDYEHHDHIHIADPARHANDKERGVHASTDIPKGTLLISVPRRCIVTTDMGRTLPLAKKIKESEHHLYAPRHIYIVLYILWDITTNGSDSFFHPYYDVLPKSFPNCPIYWSPEELEYLEGSFLVNDIMRRKRAMWEDYITVRRIAKAEGERWFDGITLEQFQWARMAIMSRNFAFVDGTQTRIWAMVPQADMLNHQRPPEVKWTFNVEEDAFLVTAMVDIPAGAPIHESYGRKSNHRHLLNYGFSVENNFDDNGTSPNQVDIDLVVSRTDPIFLRKMSFWLSDKLSEFDVVVYYHSAPKPLRSQYAWTNAYPVINRVNSGDENIANGDDNKELLAESHVASNPLEGDPVIRPSPSAELLHGNVGIHDGQTSEEEDDDDDLLCEDEIHDDVYRRKTLRVSTSNDDNTMLLFSLLRALACNNEDLDLLACRTKDGMMDGTNGSARALDDIREPISLRNEFVAMTILTEIMIDHLALFPTSIDEDVSDLADKEKYPPYSNRRNAKIQVKAEKEVLCHFLLWAQSATYVMKAMLRESKESFDIDPDLYANEDGPHPTVEMAIEELHEAEVHSSILHYCDSVLDILRDSTREVGSRRSSTSSSSVEEDDDDDDQ